MPSHSELLFESMSVRQAIEWTIHHGTPAQPELLEHDLPSIDFEFSPYPEVTLDR